MKKSLSILLIVIAIACFAGALSYPLKYYLEKDDNENAMEELRAMRRAALESEIPDPPSQPQTQEIELLNQSMENATVSPIGGTDISVAATADSWLPNQSPLPVQADYIPGKNSAPAIEGGVDAFQADAVPVTATEEGWIPDVPQSTDKNQPAQLPEAQRIEADQADIPSSGIDAQFIAPEQAAQAPITGIAGQALLPQTDAPGNVPEVDAAQQQIVPAAGETPAPEPETRLWEKTIEPIPTDRRYREEQALTYIQKEKVELDTDLILPYYREMYEQNNDLVGWLYIPGTNVDYPVLQSEVQDYYLHKDFYGKKNNNGQLILDSSCDPWTPSYNLVISGHNMNSGKMFGSLDKFASKSYWARHKTLTFDTLMREGQYVVFAAFYSADYDVNEKGFRYNADIQYRLDAEMWLEEVMKNRIYDTGVDVKFGDEILTLTTCLYQRKNGRFVVVARRLRDGEVIE